MSLNVGELVGFLRLDMGDFESGMAKGQALADKLDGKNVDVKVEADTGVAEAKLAAVAASEAKVDDGNKKVAQSGQDAGRGMGAMVTAVLLLGPALVPLAAGAAGLAVGFGAMGVAGILAVVGISQEMKKGTPLGLAYTGMLATLKGDLTTLGKTAASGTLAPFQQAVADLQTKMPGLNSIVGEFSAITGRTAGALMTGLVAAFIALAPLARDAGMYILTLSQHFASAMSGPGVVSFGDYIRSVFPQVMQAVESIVGAVIHLVAALAPLGGGTLTMLKVFSDVISAIPVDVLSNLATVAIPLFIGFKTFGLLSGGIMAVSAALTAVGVSADVAAGGILALNIAAGAIGAVIAIAMFAFTAFSGSSQQATQATNDYTDALIRSNGAIDANVREKAFLHLQDSGGLEDAKALGLNLSTVNDAMMGNVPASRALGAQMAAMAGNTNLSSSASLVQAGHIQNLSGILGTSTGQFKNSVQAQKDHAAATAAGTAVITPAAAAMVAFGLANMNAATATDKDKAAITALNTAMDAELSRALQLAGATSGYDQAVLTMTTTLKANKRSMDEHTQAGISDRQSIEATVGSLQSMRDTQIKATGSTTAATVKYQANSAALLAQMGRLYGTKSEAYKYAASLLAIPKSVTTVINAKKEAAAAAIAAIQGQVNTLLRAHPVVSISTTGYAATYQYLRNIQSLVNTISGSKVRVAMGPGGSGGSTLAGGGLIGRAGGGGLLTGPGTPTSDSITGVDASGTAIVQVSRDEFVVNAAAYAKNKALVNAINDGTQGFAGGGQIGGASGAKFNVEKMVVVGYNPDDAVQKFGHEVKWQMAGAT